MTPGIPCRWSAFTPLQNALSAAWSGFSDSERTTIRRFLTSTIEATNRAKDATTAERAGQHDGDG